MQGGEIVGSLRETWAEILQHIERFKTADFFLLSTPMWNFSIPYMLKHYIDLIVQPNYLFRYRKDKTVEGLVQNRKMVILATSGGEYGKENQHMDFQEPYLRSIFGFIGISDISFIRAEPMDQGETLRNEKLSDAHKAVKSLVESLHA